ncbi:MAG: glycosyltransferase family 39 protein [Anaerolineae bacterium]|nr:glycosyltransferase family 39 protein [Anaerolineae bacterium]MDW8173258.1 glycosyltransferase family 39 protein [Anaerolineae bacterium]
MSRRAALSAFALLILLAFALRLHRIGEASLRGDEGFSAQYWAGLPLGESLVNIATLEPHPPLTYAVFRAWGLVFGISSETVLRLLPALANLLGMAALYAIGKRLHSRLAGLIAAASWAFHPYLIWHSQDFRNYAVWSGLSAVTLWLGLRAVLSRRQIGLYSLMALSTALIFYAELFSLAALCLWGAWHNWPSRDRAWLRRWLIMHSLLAFVVALILLYYQGSLLAFGGYGGNTGGFDPVRLVERLLPTLALGETLPSAWLSLVGFAMLFALPLAWSTIGRRQPANAVLLATLILVPLLALSAISLRVSIFNARYVLASLPAYLLTFSLLLAALWSTRRVFSLGLLAIWSVVAMLSLWNYFNDPTFSKSPDWRRLVQVLSQRLSSDDYVLQATVDAGFGYYFDDDARNKALPYHPNQSPEEILSILQPIAAQHESLWLIGQTPSDWPNRAVVVNWLDAERQLIFEDWILGFRVRLYRPWQLSTDEIDEPRERFGEVVQIVGFHWLEPPLEEHLHLWTSWQTLGVSASSLKLFYHVIGAPRANGSPLWTQEDHYPQRGRLDSRAWADGLLWRDVATLELGNLPRGEYALVVGWYNPVDGQRLLTTRGADHLELARLIHDEQGWRVEKN